MTSQHLFLLSVYIKFIYVLVPGRIFSHVIFDCAVHTDVLDCVLYRFKFYGDGDPVKQTDRLKIYNFS